MTIAVYGVGSDQALAATIGPLVEVPVLLALTWVALFLRRTLRWGKATPDVEAGVAASGLGGESVGGQGIGQGVDEKPAVESGIEEEVV